MGCCASREPGSKYIAVSEPRRSVLGLQSSFCFPVLESNMCFARTG